MIITTAPSALWQRRAAIPAWRTRGFAVDTGLGRIREQAIGASVAPGTGSACQVTQDETSFTLNFDVPGIAKDQLNIGIEGNVVRIETKPEAARQYKSAWELPQDIDVSASDARLENGVLTLKLAKKVPVSTVSTLTIN